MEQRILLILWKNLGFQDTPFRACFFGDVQAQRTQDSLTARGVIHTGALSMESLRSV